MLRQYGPQRFTMETFAGRTIPVGTIPVGTIARIGVAPGSMRTRKVLVLAWLPREYAAARRAHAPGRPWWKSTYVNTFMARGGHLALCRDLSNGRMIRVADCYLRDQE